MAKATPTPEAPDTSLIDSLSERKAAERIGISRQALAAHRKAGTGPAWFVLPGGFHYRYRVVDLQAWINTLIAHPDKEKIARVGFGRPKPEPIPFEQTPIGVAIAEADAKPATLSQTERDELEEALTAEQPAVVVEAVSVGVFDPATLDA